MTTVLRFPQERTRQQQVRQRDQQLQHDAYYQFLKNVLVMVNDCGFNKHRNVEAAAQAWYDRHHRHSPLANSLPRSTPLD